MADKIYCISCGSENDSAAEKCAHCGRPLHPKETLLKDYLVSKTKDSLKEKAEDSLYEAIKNWLITHLYGLLVTVAVVSAAVVRINAAPAVPSYIEEVSVSQPPAAETVSDENSTEPETVPEETPAETGLQLDDELKEYLDVMGEGYVERFVSSLPDIESDGFEGHGYRASMEDYVLPASSGFTSHISYYHYIMDSHGAYDSIRTEFSGHTLNEPATSAGIALHNAGYDVAESTMTETMWDSESGASASVNWRLVYAKVDGEWYIAEMSEEGGGQ